MSWLDDLDGLKTILLNGVALIQRSKINFIGSGVSAVDNPATGATDVTILAGGGGEGTGDVVGPASSTDQAVARFSSTTGKVIQNSPVTIDGLGNISVPESRTVDGRDVSVDGAKLDGIAAGAAAVTSDSPANVTRAAAIVGVATTAARADHKHDVATAAPATIGTANSEGSSTSLARADHVHSHGDLAGGALHAAATTSVSGFMSAADKTKLDGVSSGAAGLGDTNPVAVGSTASPGIATTAARSDHVHTHANLGGGLMHAEATGEVAGFMSPSDKGKLNNIAVNAAAVETSVAPANVTKATASVGSSANAARADHKHDIATAAPSTIGTANTEGSSSSLSRADHVHSHGNQAGGSLHAVSTGSVSGFMSAAHHVDLENVKVGARSSMVIAGGDHVLALNDLGRYVAVSGALLEIPEQSSVAWPDNCPFVRILTANAVNVEGLGAATVDVPDGFTAKIKAGGHARLVRLFANSWALRGDLEPYVPEGIGSHPVIAGTRVTDEEGFHTLFSLAGATFTPNSTYRLEGFVKVRTAEHDEWNEFEIFASYFRTEKLAVNVLIDETGSIAHVYPVDSVIEFERPTSPFTTDSWLTWDIKDGNLHLLAVHVEDLDGLDVHWGYEFAMSSFTADVTP